MYFDNQVSLFNRNVNPSNFDIYLFDVTDLLSSIVDAFALLSAFTLRPNYLTNSSVIFKLLPGCA